MTVQEFKSQIEAKNPVNISRDVDSCDWFFGEIKLFHERSCWKPGLRPMRVEYWGETIYTDKKLAKLDAKQYGAKVQKSWYCDDEFPTWFLIFNDLDRAVEYSFDQINKIDTTK